MNAAANAKPSEIAKAAVEGKPLSDGELLHASMCRLYRTILTASTFVGELGELASKLSIKKASGSENGSRQYYLPGEDPRTEWRC